MDIINFTDFNLEEFYRDIYSINKDIKVFLVSARSGEGMKELCDYLKEKANKRL
jgi:hydrogenase nickel incorporation protein HypB